MKPQPGAAALCGRGSYVRVEDTIAILFLDANALIDDVNTQHALKRLVHVRRHVQMDVHFDLAAEAKLCVGWFSTHNSSR